MEKPFFASGCINTDQRMYVAHGLRFADFCYKRCLIFLIHTKSPLVLLVGLSFPFGKRPPHPPPMENCLFASGCPGELAALADCFHRSESCSCMGSPSSLSARTCSSQGAVSLEMPEAAA